MIYELWNTHTKNLVASFESEEAALAAIRQAYSANGPDYVARLVLARENSAGRSDTVALGDELVKRATDLERAQDAVPSAGAHRA